MSTLKEIGASQAAALVEMVAALEVDYDRLEKLRELDAGKHLDGAELDELAELEAAAGECTSEEEARTAIEEDALSVEVRGAWRSIGDQDGLAEPVEFMILLATGGPAARIRGELADGQPTRAWLEVQDWGTPWTRHEDIDEDTLLAYASVFYFGES
jgi:hypothetical protein